MPFIQSFILIDFKIKALGHNSTGTKIRDTIDTRQYWYSDKYHQVEVQLKITEQNESFSWFEGLFLHGAQLAALLYMIKSHSKKIWNQKCPKWENSSLNHSLNIPCNKIANLQKTKMSTTWQLPHFCCLLHSGDPVKGLWAHVDLKNDKQEFCLVFFHSNNYSNIVQKSDFCVLSLISSQ